MKRSTVYALMILLLTLTQAAYSARILLVSAQFLSHIIMQLSIGEELVQRGHEVHVVVGSRFPKPDSIRKTGVRILDYHVPSDVVDALSEEFQRHIAEMAFNSSISSIDMAREESQKGYEECGMMLTDRKFLDRARQLQFDIAIVEPFLLAPCSPLLPHLLNIPFVSYTTFLPPLDIGIPLLPSMFVLPGLKGAAFPTLDTFFGRLQNTVVFITIVPLVKLLHRNTTLLEQYAPGVSSWTDLYRRSELFLLDFDHHLDQPMPTMPNVILVAGTTVKPAQTLPPELEEIFSSSGDHGVIIVSFGSTAYYLPDDIIAKFIEAFSRLNQTVVARFPLPVGVELPKNVRLLSWLPQNDILGDRRTRLFITHCGANGQIESLYHGVPMLGFPLFAEQDGNCQRARRKGFGLQLDIMDFTVDQLVDNIRELIENDTYRTAISKMSVIYRDRPMSGRQLAAFWVEHVIKYGSQHLKSSASRMPLYQLYMFDILALCFVTVLCLVMGCACLVKRSIARCRRPRIVLSAKSRDEKKRD